MLIEIVAHINRNEPDVVPFAPYVVDCLALNDDNPEERKKGMANNKTLLESGIVEEIRLYGNILSPGMIEEVIIALWNGITIVPMTDQTKEAYGLWYAEY